MNKTTTIPETIEFEFEHHLSFVEHRNGLNEVRIVPITVSGDAKRYKGPGGSTIYHGEITHVFFAPKGHDEGNCIDLVRATCYAMTSGKHNIPLELQARANVHAECEIIAREIKASLARTTAQMERRIMQQSPARVYVTRTDFGMVFEAAPSSPNARPATIAEAILMMDSTRPPYSENLSWRFLVDTAKAELGKEEKAA